ncbi:MAG TPA: hypothetical protein VGL21_20710 [Jatrophihabitantaceae bacterium]|jgi:hypothetical protein
MRTRSSRTWIAALLAVASLVLAGCTVTVTGHATTPGLDGPKASLTVVGDSGNDFDQLAKNALTDAMAFWRTAYPSVSGGKPLPELRGKIYSVGMPTPDPLVRREGCIKHDGLDAVIDNRTRRDTASPCRRRTWTRPRSR